MALDLIPLLMSAKPNAVEAHPLAGCLEPDVPVTVSSEEAEVLQRSIKAGSVAQIIVASIAFIELIYLLKLVLAIRVLLL